MRILIISHTYISPINKDKWKTLARLYPGVELQVVFPKRWPSCLFKHKPAVTHNENLPNCKMIQLDTFKEGNELLYGYAPRQFYKVIKSFKPNLIHVEQGDGALSYFQANMYTRLLRLKSKSVFFTWLNWKHNPSFKHRFFLTPIEKINLACATGAIAGNNDARALLQQKGFSKPIMVLPQLGINPDIFNASHKNKSSSSIHYVAFIGRITEEKGIFTLANAFQKLQNKFPNWKLVFIGSGRSHSKLRTIVTNKRIQHLIEFCNTMPHEKIAQLLEKIDILVLPSYDTPTWREQFGHVLIEAMSSKVPVIGSNAGEIPYVISDSGLIFKQQDEIDLKKQLEKLMGNQELRKELGQRGHKRVNSLYTHRVIAEKTFSFWNQLLN